MGSLRQVAAGVLVAGLVSAFAPLAAAAPVQGERAAPRALHVEAFDVEQVGELGVGVQLVFTVYGSPGALATLRIDGAGRDLALREVEPGVYEGVYTIAAGDRIAADGRVVATLLRGDQLARSMLQESLLLGAAAPVVVAAPVVEPRAARLAEARPVPAASPPPWRQPAPLPEPASTTLPAPTSAPLPASMPMPMPTPLRAAPATATCIDCAVVESIRAVEPASGPDRAGAFAGSVAGSIFGERIGAAHARNVTRVLGVLSGRGASEPERRWDVVLRMPDGSVRHRRYESLPSFQVGETIRVGGGETLR